jgi:hypothetical protein
MYVKGFMLFPKRILWLVLIGVVILGCRRYALRGSGGFVLQPGDLLFQDLDTGPLCEAIEKVTTGYQGENFSHVGIAAQDERGKLVVIEAVSAGVKATSLQDFLGRSLDKEGRPKVAVGRLKTDYCHLIPSAIKEALALRGKPYDKVFAADNDAYYCSELVYEIFRRANKDVALFAVQPMTFKDSETGRTDPAWEQYFAGLGVPVPEGEPGINPGAISRSDVLIIFHAYGEPSRSGPGGAGNRVSVPMVRQ